jgi:hypothetical protein
MFISKAHFGLPLTLLVLSSITASMHASLSLSCAKELISYSNFVFQTKNIEPLDILIFLKRLGCFPNANIAYIILLTIQVTVASVQRSFSKVKLLRSLYLYYDDIKID